MIRKVLLGLFGLFLIMQLVRIDRNNPVVDQDVNMVNMVNPPENIASTLKKACYDCHSFETVYPWYTNVAPLSWWIGDHIDHGREELNFSIWGTYSDKRRLHKIEELEEMVEEGEMPLESYLIAHAEAELTDEEVADLIAWSHTLE
jgi:hypothetical protein